MFEKLGSVAGYACYFGIWSLTKTHISKTAVLWSALCMTISALFFASFEIYKMILTTKSLHNYSSHITNFPKTMEEYSKRQAEHLNNSKTQGVRLIRVWTIIISITIGTAAIAIVISFLSFIHSLINSY